MQITYALQRPSSIRQNRLTDCRASSRIARSLPKQNASAMAEERVIYWGSGSTPAWKALVGLEEKQLSYESKLVEFSKGGHKTPEIFALNPRGQVPTFSDKGTVVNESLAILLYLEDAYPQPSLMPSSAKGRALVYQRLIESANFQEKLSGIVRLKLFSKDASPEAFKEKTDALKTEVKLWEDYAKSGHIAGDKFTLADASVGPIVLCLKRFGATFQDYPNLNAYSEKMQARPSVSKTTPPHWATTPDQDWLAGVI